MIRGCFGCRRLARRVSPFLGDKFPQWLNNMLAGALNGLSLQRVAFNQPSQAERRAPLLGLPSR
jgi:hypothetical protein